MSEEITHEDYILNFLEQLAIIFKIPIELLTDNTKYKNYEKENENKS